MMMLRRYRAALRPTQALRRVVAVAAPGAGRARRGVGGQGTHHLAAAVADKKHRKIGKLWVYSL